MCIIKGEEMEDNTYPDAAVSPVTHNADYNGMERGLTKREYFSAMCMQGMLADGTSESHLLDYATRAVRAADFLIEALNKEEI